MKTTIEISDAVLAAARQLAASRGTTLRALVEAGLRQVVAEQSKRASPFKLRRAAFKGRGLRPELQGRTWEQLRDAVYEGRGA